MPGITTPPDRAAEELRAAGFKPREVYPGITTARWKAECLTCGYPCSLSLQEVRNSRRRCAHRRWTQPSLSRLLAELGYEPMEEYPGLTRLAWRLACVRCGVPYSSSVSNLLRTRKRCRCVQAEAELRAAGYEPLGPWPGNNRLPWPSRCVACGQRRTPNLDTIRAGRRCQHATDSWWASRDKAPAG